MQAAGERNPTTSGDLLNCLFMHVSESAIDPIVASDLTILHLTRQPKSQTAFNRSLASMRKTRVPARRLQNRADECLGRRQDRLG